LQRIVEKAVHRVPVVGVVLRCVDAALRGDAVRAPGTVLVAEGFHIVAHLGQGGGRGGAGQAGAHDNDVDTALVGRVHQADLVLVPAPFFLNGTGRDLGVQDAHG